jgi:hypothetical protein
LFTYQAARDRRTPQGAMSPESAATKLRASLVFHGPRPVLRSWDVVCILRLTDPELVDLHQRLSLAHMEAGSDPALLVPELTTAYEDITILDAREALAVGLATRIAATGEG